MDLVTESCGSIESTCLAIDRYHLDPIQGSIRASSQNTSFTIPKLDVSMGSMDLCGFELCDHFSSGLELFQPVIFGRRFREFLCGVAVDGSDVSGLEALEED